MTDRAKTLLGRVFANLIFLVICFPLYLCLWVDLVPWHALWMVGLWIGVSLGFSLPGSLRRFKAARWRPLPRMTLKEADAFGAWLLILGVLCMVCLVGIDGLAETLRLRTGLSPAPAFLLGFAAYLPLVLSFKVVARRTEGPLEASRGFLQRMRRLVPRDRKGRRIIAVALLFNPFIEEISYRGILVLLLATYVGIVPAVLFGLLACVAGHLYQGPKGLPFHVSFYILALCLLFSDAGMWGAFGLHMAGDVIPWVRVPLELRRLRTLRAARATAGPGRRSRAAVDPGAVSPR